MRLTSDLPKIISLKPTQWREVKPSRFTRFKRNNTLIQYAALLRLAGPTIRLTTAALIFEGGKIIASLLAPELYPWSVSL